MASIILKRIPSSLTDIKTLNKFLKRPKTFAFAYAFMFAFVCFTFFLIFTPSTAPWFITISDRSDSYRSHIDSFFLYFFPPSKFPVRSVHYDPYRSNDVIRRSMNRTSIGSNRKNVSVDLSINRNLTVPSVRPNLNTYDSDKLPFLSANKEPSDQGNVRSNTKNASVVSTILNKNQTSVVYSTSNISDGNTDPTWIVDPSTKSSFPTKTRTSIASTNLNKNRIPILNSSTKSSDANTNQISGVNTTSSTNWTTMAESNTKGSDPKKGMVDLRPRKVTVSNVTDFSIQQKLIDSLLKCKLYDGEWVRDYSYPLYSPGSCSLIDEQFNCVLNGRPDKDFMKLKWKPRGCSLPRLNGIHMLELLRGKRLVFVGDSLNRNMWESLVCILKNSLKDQTRVYEASGMQSLRSEASYSFVFQDYNCSVEFYVSPFLVQEWKTLEKNGSRKETLRLDIVEKSCDDYKTADFIIFNTGHWWTHEKTSTGKDYYQEGSHVYNELDVVEAFRRALTTWGRWIDANIKSSKSSIFFRGYSASHFSGGQWNSGGACDNETQPIKNEAYLSEYPGKMVVLERVLKGMKTQVTYLNVTRITDHRKEAHPSVYRKQNLSPEELKTSLRYQDCSHWCLPGVPDTWNELLFAELLIKLRQNQLQDDHNHNLS